MDVNLEQQVRRRAYELWLGDGKADGRASDHWYKAECEVLGRSDGDSPAAQIAPAAKRKARAKKVKH